MKKVALVHDWLIHMRGGEKVLQALAEMYPTATIYTLFCNRKKLSSELQNMKIKTSFLQHLPGIRSYYRWLLPILPFVIRTMKVSDADLVISSSHCVAKGIRVPERAMHVCYCHTPMRYLWGFEDVYFKKPPFFIRPFLKLVFFFLRRWDKKNNRTVDYFIANSQNVQKRIKKYYDRDSAVIYPPLDIKRYHPSDGERGDYYLVVSAFVPYKRVDLVIETFNRWDRKLMIVGSGPLNSFYRRLRKSSNIFFVGSVSDHELQDLYSKARAVIFPTDEDFGIVPLEAQACGTPVIAYGRGGALESVKVGSFFGEQTVASLKDAIEQSEKKKYDAKEAIIHVASFSADHFKEHISAFILKHVKEEKAYAEITS